MFWANDRFLGQTSQKKIKSKTKEKQARSLGNIQAID